MNKIFSAEAPAQVVNIKSSVTKNLFSIKTSSKNFSASLTQKNNFGNAAGKKRRCIENNRDFLQLEICGKIDAAQN